MIKSNAKRLIVALFSSFLCLSACFATSTAVDVLDLNANRQGRNVTLQGDWSRGSFFAWHQVSIIKIDEQAFNSRQGSQPLRIRPGEHVINVRASFNESLWSGPYFVILQIKYKFAKNLKYVVKMSVDGDEIKVWLSVNKHPVTEPVSAKYRPVAGNEENTTPMNI